MRFFQKLMKIQVSWKHLIPLIFLTILTFITYSPRFGMYFYYDDYTMMYYSQANIPTPYPYQPVTYLFDFFKNFFGLNYIGYAVVNFVLALSATYLLYFLSFKLFRNNILAGLAAATFPNDYVGQMEINIFISLGLTTFTALNLYLLTLFFFITYLYNQQSKKLIFITYFLYFLTIEIGALRYPFIFLVFILTDWLYHFYFGRIKPRIILLRNSIFFFIFLIQYVVKPSRVLLHYPIMYGEKTSLNWINNFHYNLVNSTLNAIGSFWNLLFPRFFQIKFYLLLKNSSFQIPNKELIISIVPVILFCILILTLIKLLRPNIKLYKIIVIIMTLIITTIFLVISVRVADLPDKISIINGVIFLIFLLSLLILKVPKYLFIAYFSLILLTNLFTYIYAGNLSEYVFDSTFRYLFTNSFIVAFITSFFVTKEMFEKNGKKLIAWIIYLLPVSLLIILPAIAGYTTQSIFAKDYGNRPVKLFSELKSYIPEIKDKTLIHLEGDNPDLQRLVSDSIIAGTFPSERVFAIQYNTDERKFISLENLDDLSAVMKKNPDLKLENIHSFIYSADGLHDLSSALRKLVSSKEDQIAIKSNSWMVEPGYNRISQDDLIVSIKAAPDSKMILPLGHMVKSQLPMRVKLRAKGKATHLPHQGKITVLWSYDIFTPHKIDQEKLITIDLDDQWHEYQFKIPAYGRYLDSLKIEQISFTGVISLSDIYIDYLR